MKRNEGFYHCSTALGDFWNCNCSLLCGICGKQKEKSKKENGKRKSESYSGMGIAIGMCFGVLIGCLTDNLGLWIPIGLLVGMILDVFYK